MPSLLLNRVFTPRLLIAVTAFCMASFARADDPPIIRSQESGVWSSAKTWDAGRLPKAGDRVVIRSGNHMTYDLDSKEVIRLVQIAGTLEFARDRNTRLEAGLITVRASEEPNEQGFDCHLSPEPIAPGRPRPTLLVGTPDEPIPALQCPHSSPLPPWYGQGFLSRGDLLRRPDGIPRRANFQYLGQTRPAGC